MFVLGWCCLLGNVAAEGWTEGGAEGALVHATRLLVVLAGLDAVLELTLGAGLGHGVVEQGVALSVLDNTLLLPDVWVFVRWDAVATDLVVWVGQRKVGWSDEHWRLTKEELFASHEEHDVHDGDDDDD